MSISVSSSEDRSSILRPASIFKRVLCFTLIFSFLLFSLCVPSSAVFLVDDITIAGSIIFTLAAMGVSLKFADVVADSDIVDGLKDIFQKADVPFSWQNQSVSVPANGVTKVSRGIAEAAYNLSQWIKGEADGASSLTLISPGSGLGFISSDGVPLSFGNIETAFYTSSDRSYTIPLTPGTSIPITPALDGVSYVDAEGNGIHFVLNQVSGYYNIFARLVSDSVLTSTELGNFSMGRELAPGVFEYNGTFFLQVFSYSGVDRLAVCGVNNRNLPASSYRTIGSLTSNVPISSISLSELSSVGASAVITSDSVVEEPSTDLYVATPYTFTDVSQIASVSAALATTADSIISGVSGETLAEVLDVQSSILENSTSILNSLTAGESWLEYNIPTNFSVSTIWYYVVHWLHNIGDFTDLVFGFLHQIPDYYTAPFYACIVLTIFCGVFRKMIGV